MKNSKRYLGAMGIAILFIASACKKENTAPASNTSHYYISMADFYDRNGVQAEIHTMDATSGGSFITAKGTKVTVPAGAFITESGIPASGTVNIEFKDIYSKADMLLSDVTAKYYDGTPLKSAGEFFIRVADAAGTPLTLVTGQHITIEQPNPAGTADTNMEALVGLEDSIGVWGGVGMGMTWAPNPNDSIAFATSSYIFSLYNFTSPASGGTWCNSDNSSYFSAYSQTVLGINPMDDPDAYHTDVFLCFSGVNSMVHVYRSWGVTPIAYNYSYAPVGLQCTLVAIGAKDGKLYSSFTPVTISQGQTVNFTLTETSDAVFKAQLNTLN